MTQGTRMQRRQSLAQVLRRARGFSLLTQDELADQLGISRRSVAGYEAGDTEPPAVIVLEWLRVCGRPLDDLAFDATGWLLGMGLTAHMRDVTFGEQQVADERSSELVSCR